MKSDQLLLSLPPSFPPSFLPSLHPSLLPISFLFCVLQSLPSALKLLCEILSLDPEGSAARIPLDQFHQLYKFLATVDGEVSADQVEAVMEFLTTESYVSMLKYCIIN